MNDDITERARQLLDAATPGPWTYKGEVVRDAVKGWHIVADPDDDGTGILIAAAPTLIAELVAEVEQLRTQLAARTDPDLAARLHLLATDDDVWENPPLRAREDVEYAARLLGGTDG